MKREDRVPSTLARLMKVRRHQRQMQLIRTRVSLQEGRPLAGE
jgi:hypothetical protein